MTTGRTQVEAAVAQAHRDEWTYVLAATVRVTHDIDIAEECVQDAYARALSAWAINGIPERPGAWLTTVARRLAIDFHRRREIQDRLLPYMNGVAEETMDLDHNSTSVGDDRLQLIFTCCHPALAFESQIALTLRYICGLTTSEVARVFLVTESTMAARLTRAKKKISVSHIPFQVPAPLDLPERTDAVLEVVHLLFTTGHTAPTGSVLVREDLTSRAIELARMLRQLLPGNSGVAGLLSLMLLSDARRIARTSPDGTMILLGDQDRSKWDRELIDEGIHLVREALTHRPPSRFALMAAIGAVHAEAPSLCETDWREIVAIYDLLVLTWPSPVVRLNRAAAVGFVDGPRAGLAALDELAGDPFLSHYAYYASARAEFLARLGCWDQARDAYEMALETCHNDIERNFLRRRLDDLKLPP